TISAGTSGGAYFNATGTLATTAKQTLTLGDNNTGNINFYSSANVLTSAGNLTLAATTNTINGASINGSTQSFTANNIADSGSLTIKSGGSGTLTLDTTGNQQINIGNTNANAITLGNGGQ